MSESSTAIRTEAGCVICPGGYDHARAEAQLVTTWSHGPVGGVAEFPEQSGDDERRGGRGENTCSPTSTALSPIRSIARATSIIVIAHSRTSGSLPISTARWKISLLSWLISASWRTRSSASATSRSRNACLDCETSDRASAPIRSIFARISWSTGGSVPGERQDLGDVHALVAHPLGVLDHVQQRRHDAQVARHRRLQGEQREDPLVDLEVAAVDPVVVGDHDRRELDVAVVQRLERAVQRRDHQVERAERLLLEPGELLLEVDPLRGRH